MFRDPIKSSVRTLQVLELFNEWRRPLRLTEIYEHLKFPQSSTTILLKSMVVTGYLNYERDTRTYFPSSRVAALGDWINHYVFGPGDLAELVCTVRDRTNETVAVSAQNDIFVQHLRVVQPNHDYKNAPPEGTMRAMTDSASGLALISRMSPESIDMMTRHISIYQQKRVDRDALNDQLAWVRREGYAIMAGFPMPEYAGLAIPLPRARHRIPLALGVGGQNARIMRNKTSIIAIMREAIGDYEAKLAAIPTPSVPPIDFPI